MTVTEAEAIRASFQTELLDEGIESLGCSCPKCSHWICSLPTIQFKNWKDKRSKVYIWECWNCKTEFVQVQLTDKNAK